MGQVETSISCYDSALAIDPSCTSALYNKRFALYRIGKSNEADLCKQTLESIDPGFESALKDRGTQFFLPTMYSESLDYQLPARWYPEDNTTSQQQNGSVGYEPQPAHSPTFSPRT
jgi:hypothetical protein